MKSTIIPNANPNLRLVTAVYGAFCSDDDESPHINWDEYLIVAWRIYHDEVEDALRSDPIVAGAGPGENPDCAGDCDEHWVIYDSATEQCFPAGLGGVLQHDSLAAYKRHMAEWAEWRAKREQAAKKEPTK